MADLGLVKRENVWRDMGSTGGEGVGCAWQDIGGAEDWERFMGTRIGGGRFRTEVEVLRAGLLVFEKLSR